MVYTLLALIIFWFCYDDYKCNREDYAHSRVTKPSKHSVIWFIVTWAFLSTVTSNCIWGFYTRNGKLLYELIVGFLTLWGVFSYSLWKLIVRFKHFRS